MQTIKQLNDEELHDLYYSPVGIGKKILLETCWCLKKGKPDPNCFDCDGKGALVTENGKQLLRFLEMVGK